MLALVLGDGLRSVWQTALRLIDRAALETIHSVPLPFGLELQLTLFGIGSTK